VLVAAEAVAVPVAATAAAATATAATRAVVLRVVMRSSPRCGIGFGRKIIEPSCAK
jgi:hypothetical protein